MNTIDISLDEFSEQARKSIPLLEAMELRFTRFGDYRLRVDVPLEPNINDKRTGFGGSISALATTAGWAVVSLLLRPRMGEYDVMVAESHIRYLAPATCNFYAIAAVTESAIKTFYGLLEKQHQGRLTVQVVVEQDGKQIAVYTGTYKVAQKPSL